MTWRTVGWVGRELNFSEWQRYSPEKVAHKRAKSVTELEEGTMPPEARLTATEQAQLTAWLARR